MANKRNKMGNNQNVGVLHTGAGEYVIKNGQGKELARLNYIFNDEVQDEIMDMAMEIENRKIEIAAIEKECEINGGKIIEENVEGIKKLRREQTKILDAVFKVLLLPDSYPIYENLTFKNTAMKQELHSLLFSYLQSSQYATKNRISNRYIAMKKGNNFSA